ncbi:hypothetical protein [Stomatohabitans albus]|uniref:hypothetical protein n=1 Tax=Stomatohabitans albus TaxID=3110766 RepID=UPI00300D7989
MTHLVPIERQKAAQAAGEFSLEELPGSLAKPDAAVRIGKTPAGDQVLHGGKSLDDIATINPGEGLIVMGKAEVRWTMAYYTRFGGKVSREQLLTYARQFVGMHPDGSLAMCLSGHAGRGPAIPLWAPRDEISLIVQPNDLVLRYTDVVPEADINR